MEDSVETESEDTDCEFIGDIVDVFVHAPPKQIRKFEKYVNFSGSKTRPTDKLKWRYKILHAHGG